MTVLRGSPTRHNGGDSRACGDGGSPGYRGVDPEAALPCRQARDA